MAYSYKFTILNIYINSSVVYLNSLIFCGFTVLNCILVTRRLHHYGRRMWRGRHVIWATSGDSEDIGGP